MATAESIDLGPSHAPLEESIAAFEKIEVDIKRQLQHLRHDYNKHEPEYFAAVQHLSDAQLTTFTSDDLYQVRVADSAYGLHLLGMVFLPESGSGYFQFRAFVSGDGVKLHSIHTEEKTNPDGTKSHRAIFTNKDSLEWFET